MKINAALAGILNISGAHWWVGLIAFVICTTMSYAVRIARILLPRNSQDRLAWWNGYWNRPRRTRRPRR